MYGGIHHSERLVVENIPKHLNRECFFCYASDGIPDIVRNDHYGQVQEKVEKNKKPLHDTNQRLTTKLLRCHCGAFTTKERTRKIRIVFAKQTVKAIQAKRSVDRGYTTGFSLSPPWIYDISMCPRTYVHKYRAQGRPLQPPSLRKTEKRESQKAKKQM